MPLQWVQVKTLGNGVNGVGIPLYFAHCKIRIITMTNVTRTNFVSCSVLALADNDDRNGIAIFHREESHTLAVGVIWTGELELFPTQKLLARFEDTAAGAVPQNLDELIVTVGYEPL